MDEQQLTQQLYQAGKTVAGPHKAICFGSAALDKDGNLLSVGFNNGAFHNALPPHILADNKKRRATIDEILRRRAPQFKAQLGSIGKPSVGDNVGLHAEMATLFNLASAFNRAAASSSLEEELDRVKSIAVMAVHPRENYYGVRKMKTDLAAQELFTCVKCARIMVILGANILVRTDEGFISIPPEEAYEQAKRNEFKRKRANVANDNDRFSWAQQADLLDKYDKPMTDTGYIRWIRADKSFSPPA